MVDNLAIAHKLAAERNKMKQIAMKERYDTKSKEPVYKVGDKVLLHDSTKKTGVSKKLSYQWLGPFEIIEQTSPVNFRLAGMGRRADIVHSDRLKPYPTPAKNSIRRTQPEGHIPADHIKSTKKDQTEMIQKDTTELIDKIQTFLDPEQVIGKRKQ